MSNLTEEQLQSVAQNRLAYARMSLEQRLAMRKQLSDGVKSTQSFIGRTLLRRFMPKNAAAELQANIRMIDELNLQERLDARKRSGVNQR